MISERFKHLQFEAQFINLVIDRAKAIYQARRNDYTVKKQGLTNQRTALESKLLVAQDRLLDGTLPKDDYTTLTDKVKIQLAKITETINELEEAQEIQIDVTQEILGLTKNIYQTYVDASPALKRHYLGFFWDRLEAQDGVIIKSYPSPLFDELLKLNQIIYKNGKTKNPQYAGDSLQPSTVIKTASWLRIVL